MQRPTLSETKQRLLQVGRELLFERGIAVGLRNLPITDVVSRAGRTTGAAYQIWPRQELFHRDLALAVVSDEDWADSSVILDRIAPMLERGAGLKETIEAGADAYMEMLVGSRSFYVLLHFQAAALDDEELRAAVRQGYERLHQEFRDFYQAMMDIFGFELRPGHDLDDFTVAATAITEGFALRIMADPDRGWVAADPPAQRRSLYAHVILDLIDLYLQPRALQGR